MDYEISKTDIKNYIKLNKAFDWDWVDQELGFDKVFKFVPKSVYDTLKASTAEADKEIFRLLTKAAVHYAFILDIPRIKVQLSNFGIDQNNQNNIKPAPWYDVRDLGLKYLKTADSSLSKAITQLSTSNYVADIPFFANNNSLIKTPAEFSEIYNINDSPDVYLQLLPLLNRATDNYIKKALKSCTIENIVTNETTKRYLKNAMANYALSYAASSPVFTFLSNAIVVQYEELPWQKSLVLSEQAREKSAESFHSIAEESINSLLAYLKENPSVFPCYSAETLPNYLPIKKKSGLYL